MPNHRLSKSPCLAKNLFGGKKTDHKNEKTGIEQKWENNYEEEHCVQNESLLSPEQTSGVNEFGFRHSDGVEKK